MGAAPRRAPLCAFPLVCDCAGGGGRFAESSRGPALPRTCGRAPHPHRRRPLCGKPRTLSCCQRCQNWPSGLSGGGYFAGVPAPPPAPTSLRKTSHPVLLPTLPKLAWRACRGFSPCGKPRTPPRRQRCIFSLLALAGVALLLGYRVWLGGRLFANISLHRCSFMTERTKGPAVSMRRPPTRGPQDPWTPRVVTLAAIFGGCRGAPP